MGNTHDRLYKIYPFLKDKKVIMFAPTFRGNGQRSAYYPMEVLDLKKIFEEFEFALLNKPMIFFAYDIEEYARTRDFYYEFHSFIPGPLVRTTEVMLRTIHNGQYKMDLIPSFVHYFFGELDGRSSERVVNQLILQKYNQEENG